MKRTVVRGAAENGGQAPGSFALQTDCPGKTNVTKTESAPELLWMTPPDTSDSQPDLLIVCRRLGKFKGRHEKSADG